MHSHLEPIDFYGTNVGGLAYARETAYRHARTIAELGPTAFRGRDPVTAVVVGIIIVGAIITGVGVALAASGHSSGWGLAAFGGVVIVGGICVAAGACVFVLGLLLAIFV
jgi:hypothetical protein